MQTRVYFYIMKDPYSVTTASLMIRSVVCRSSGAVALTMCHRLYVTCPHIGAEVTNVLEMLS